MKPARTRNRFVYQWTDHGFFSELNYMLLAILYCRQHGREFVLSSRGAPVFHTRGWQDFFRPFCAESDTWLLRFLDGRPLTPGPGLRARLNGLDKRLRRRVLTSLVRPVAFADTEVVAENWHSLRALRNGAEVTLCVAGVQRQYPLRDALRLINHDVWRFNDETATAVRHAIDGLDLPERYAALHIRRGDMAFEAAPIDDSRYLEQLERVTSLTDLYVSTDDAQVVERIRRLRRRWRIWSLCPPGMRGYFPAEFDRQSASERGRRTLLLLTETEIMRRSDVFVGWFSSGIGTYQGIVRDRGTYDVDSRPWSFEGGL